MQHLAEQPDLDAIADAVLCVDALENVGPEDWPVVVSGLIRQTTGRRGQSARRRTVRPLTARCPAGVPSAALRHATPPGYPLYRRAPSRLTANPRTVAGAAQVAMTVSAARSRR